MYGLILLAAFAALLIVYFKSSYKYWARRKVPFLTPKIPYGNSDSLVIKGLGIGIRSKDYYDEFKSKGCGFGGIYAVTRPLFVPVDPDLIKNILSKDFQNFTDRGTFHNEKDDPLSEHLFNVGGVKWKNLRTKLTPTFTSGKMKMMFPTLLECCDNLGAAMESEAQKGPVDIKEMVSCFTTDVIGSCAFGIECNSFKDPDAEFRRTGREMMDPPLSQRLRSLVNITFPQVAKALGFCNRPDHITRFFRGAVADTVGYREKNHITRNDFVQLLIDLKNSSDGSFTMDDLAAQMFIFFVAGFETSSTTLTFCLYELAKNLEVQRRAREEISSVAAKFGQKITYESIVEMKYVKQIIEETLRKYPPGPTLNRDCTNNYRIPNTDVVLEKGTGILISTLGLHRDPEFFPDPEKFDPDRFTDENKRTIRPFTYLPFGEGPRSCIGLRFGMMQITMGLATLLKDHEFVLNYQTMDPIRLDRKTFLLSSIDRILLDAKRLS